MHKLQRKLSILLAVVMIMSTIGGCVYYNTFFNAKQAFNEAESARKKGRFRGGRVNTNLYRQAIDKALKVIENNPNSKYYDDALFVLAVSYYHTDQFGKAERRFREILANYGDSKFAQESEIYLAKSKLQLNEKKEAMDLFGMIFVSDFNKETKAEAAMELGLYNFELPDFREAQKYFRAVRDSLGDKDEKKIAQRYLADANYHLFQFEDALKSYQQILGMEPDNNQRYHAIFQSALCCYNLMRIDDGLDYLNTLANDEIYFDSLQTINLTKAQGYEYDGDLDAAINIYEEITNDEEMKNKYAAQANYQLGLIYQYDYDQLATAKEYYDKTVTLMRNSDMGKDALQRSSDIGKLDTFARKMVIDSTTSQDLIDEAAYTQYQLAELYWMSLNKPDSAILEMQYVVDSFSTAYDAPKAYIALSQMYLEQYQDTTAADSILHKALNKYPHSDYAQEIIKTLGLEGTPSDTGYPVFYIHKAEDYLLDNDNVDSAKYYYQYVIDRFPESKYSLQAKFSLIWIDENYQNPGDSSVYYAYQEIIDSFPGTEWAKAATGLINYRPQQPVQDQYQDSVILAGDSLNPNVVASAAANGEIRPDDTTYMDPLEALYYDLNGNRITDMPLSPMETREPFIYPTEAYRTGWEGTLYFQIFLDFSGEVVDYILKIKSESEDIDREASESVASMIFDATRIPQELQDKWFVYKFYVRKPDHIR